MGGDCGRLRPVASSRRAPVRRRRVHVGALVDHRGGGNCGLFGRRSHVGHHPLVLRHVLRGGHSADRPCADPAVPRASPRPAGDDPPRLRRDRRQQLPRPGAAARPRRPLARAAGWVRLDRRLRRSARLHRRGRGHQPATQVGPRRRRSRARAPSAVSRPHPPPRPPRRPSPNPGGGLLRGHGLAQRAARSRGVLPAPRKGSGCARPADVGYGAALRPASAKEGPPPRRKG